MAGMRSRARQIGELQLRAISTRLKDIPTATKSPPIMHVMRAMMQTTKLKMARMMVAAMPTMMRMRSAAVAQAVRATMPMTNMMLVMHRTYNRCLDFFSWYHFLLCYRKTTCNVLNYFDKKTLVEFCLIHGGKKHNEKTYVFHHRQISMFTLQNSPKLYVM